MVDSNTPLVGAPAFLPMSEAHHQFYFVTLPTTHGSYSRGSLNSINSLVAGALPSTCCSGCWQRRCAKPWKPTQRYRRIYTAQACGFTKQIPTFTA